MFENFELSLVFSSLLGILGPICIGLGTMYFVVIHSANLPLNLIEFMAWILTTALVLLPLPIQGPPLMNFSNGIRILISQLGLFLLPLCIGGSINLHCESTHDGTLGMIFTAGVTALVSGFSALLLQSEVIGFYSIVALFSALQFYVGTFMGGYVTGFTEDSQIAYCMIVSGLLMTIMIWAYLNDRELEPWFIPFQKGIMVWGGFAYFVGGLILSSRYYWSFDITEKFLLTNGLMLGSLLVGSVLCHSISNIRSTGFNSVINVFMVLYFLAKLSDIPWRVDNWPIMMTVLGLMMWGVSLILRSESGFALFTQLGN